MNVWIYLYTIDNFYLYPSFKVCNLILKEVASSFFSIFAYKERMCVKRFSVVSPSEHKSNMEQGTSKFKFALNSALHEFDERCHSLNALVSVIAYSIFKERSASCFASDCIYVNISTRGTSPKVSR